MTPVDSTGIPGDGVRLRSLARTDLEKLRGFVNDRDVMRFSNVYRPISDVQQEEWFAGLSGSQDSVWFAIDDIRQGDPGLIGTCCLVNMDWVARQAELRIRIGERRIWGQGLGTEATRLLIDYGFNHLNLERVWLRVYAPNARAIRMYEKIGFQAEGRLRQAAYVDGAAVDIVLMGLLREEWTLPG